MDMAEEGQGTSAFVLGVCGAEHEGNVSRVVSSWG